MRFPALQPSCIRAGVDSLFGEHACAPGNKGCDGRDAAAEPPEPLFPPTTASPPAGPARSRMFVRKRHLFPHRHLRFDRPLEDQDHVTVPRNPRPRRQLVQALDRLQIKLHGNRTGSTLSSHGRLLTSSKSSAHASIQQTARARYQPILRTYHNHVRLRQTRSPQGNRLPS